MEVSSSETTESDSFFAVNTIAESANGSVYDEDELVPLKPLSPVFLLIFADFLNPIALILCSYSTTSVFGLFFVFLLILHVFICKHASHSFFGFTFLISIEILMTAITFLFTIFSEEDQSQIRSLKIIGIPYDDRGLAIASTIFSIIFQSISIRLSKSTSPESYKQLRISVYTNSYFTYLTDILYSYSIALIASTTIADAFFLFIIYYTYSNLSLVFCGREVICKFLKIFFTFYSLLYSLFQFTMVSYIGSLVMPTSGDIWFAFIGSENDKKTCLLFSIFLAWTSIIILTNLEATKKNSVPVIFFLRNVTNVLIDILFIAVFFFASYFPNYLTILYLIIMFFATFSHRQIVHRFFFPFLGFMFIITFLIISLTQYGKFGHPLDNGSEQHYSFLKLFGFFKYEDSNRFTFCCTGFMIFASFGQIGRINSATRYHSKRKINFDIHQGELNLSDIQDRSQRILHILKNVLIKIGYFIFKIIKIMYNIIYRLLMYLSLPACIVTGIYSGLFKDKWTFQILSFLVMFIVILFLYFKWPFQILKFISGIIILACSFYKSSDSYYCRGAEKCLFFGYFNGIESSGLCPPPNESLISYCWPVCVVFFVSLFMASDDKYLRTDYPPLLIVFLYFIVSICDLAYVFEYDISIFTIFYFFIGCFIIAFQCLEWNGMRTFMIMLNFIAVSAQLSIYIIVRHDFIRNFFMSHVGNKIIRINIMQSGDGEIILLAFMLFFSSIVFHGPQKIEINKFVRNIIQFIRQINYYLYFDLSSLFLFGLSIANNYPSFIKFLFLFSLTVTSISPRFFFKCRIVYVFIFALFIITQFVFHIFLSDKSSNFIETFKYIGFYFTGDELDNHKKNISLGWEFSFVIVSLLNSPSLSSFTLADDFEKKKIIQVFRSLCACGHYLLQPFTKIVMFICASYNGTIFSWFLLFAMIQSSISPHFFYKAAPFILLFIYIYLLAIYLLYLGFPDHILHRNWADPIDLINPKYRETVAEWFEFFGIYHVQVSSLITTYASAVALAIYLHFYKVQVDYQYRYDSLPSLIKAFVEIVIQNTFKICITLVLILAVSSKKPDGLFLFVLGSLFFAATMVFDYSLISTRSIIQSYIYVISFLRILSRLPVFVDTKKSNFVIRLFDLPLRNQSDSTVYWIVMFAIIQICVQIQSSDLYLQLSKKKTKRIAYRFIRERQLSIIEKLDQDILLCKRKQEINTLIANRQENLQQEMLKSNSNLYLIDEDENQSLFESLTSSDNEIQQNNINNNNNNNNNENTNVVNNNVNNRTSGDDNVYEELISIFNDETDSDMSFIQNDDLIHVPRKDKWYHRFYYFWIEPQIIRLTRILSTSLPVNQETGINVLTLESLTILMRRCLSHYEKNQEFILEEREKQFLLALPPSFAYHYSSLYHLIDYQPLFDNKPIELLVRYLCLFLRNLSLPLLVLISTIYLYLKPYLFSIGIFVYVICIFCSLDFHDFPNTYRIFFTFVTVILGLQGAANTDLIFERLKTIQSSLTNLQSSVSALSLIGLEPNSSLAIEICLYLSCIYFLSQQIDNVHVFSTAYTYDKLCVLSGFPAEYCYGIMDDPVRNLGMKSPQTRSFIKTIKHQMNRVWLQSTVHHNFILLINAISFIVLASMWGNWETETHAIYAKETYAHSVTVFFTIAMIADVVFLLSVYFCCLNNLYFILYWIELVWLLYSLSVTFFYTRSTGDSLGKTTEFYIFVRVLQHIVVSHICFIGRSNISYRLHDFAKEWRIILFGNKCLRYFPFVFEIQSMLLWIGRDTLISFPNFLIVRTMELQLEISICKKIDKKNQIKAGAKPKLRPRIILGIFYLFLFVLAAFIPIIFWFNSDSKYVSNPVVMARIQAGISSLPPFYDTIGSVRELYQYEKRILANSTNKDYRTLLAQPQATLCLVDFPLYSNIPFSLSKTAFENFVQNVVQYNSNLNDENQSLSTPLYYKFYVKYIFFFERPATISGKTKCEYVIESEILNQQELNNSLSVISTFMINNNLTINNSFENSIFNNPIDSSFEDFSYFIYCNLILSHVFNVISTNSIKPITSSYSGFSFQIDGNSFAINISNFAKIQFLNKTSVYRLIVLSSHVINGLNAQLFYRLSGSGGFTGIYTLLIIVLGVSIREIVFKKADSVWRNRIQKPFILYKMIIAINMFKNAKDPKAEKEMCNKFLIALRNKTKGIVVEDDQIIEIKEKAD